MAALSSSYNRCEQLQAGSLRQCHQLVHHLVNGLLHDRLATVGTVRNADPGIEQTEIVVDFRDRSYG